jgi:hypothetical protein
VTPKQQRQARIAESFSRLADLFPYGQLLAETDPATLLDRACDEIERTRAEKERE